MRLSAAINETARCAAGSRPCSGRALPSARCSASTPVLINLAVAVLALALPRTARAQDEALRAPVHALAPLELASLEPYLDHTLVAHIETTELIELPQVTVVARAHVGCEAVLAVARDVASYPTILPAIDQVTIDSATDQAVSYEWTWQAAVFSFRGRASTSIMADGDGHAGFRVVFESSEGDLGRARRVLRGTPSTGEGGPSCLLVLASHHDFRDANYLARESSASAPTMSRSLNLILSIATLARVRGESERRAGVPRAHVERLLGDPRSLSVDPAGLTALLGRGEVFVVETSDGSDLGAIVGLAHLVFPEDRVRGAFLDPPRFTVGLLSGARITELGREEHLARYRWDVDLALIGSSGELAIHDANEHEVELMATSGAMCGGRLLVTTAADDGGTFATLAARIDPSDGVPIVQAIESTDPAFRPGLVASGLLMAFRGLRRGLSQGH